ncbi:MAG TPA: hypothetical protein VIH67_10405 [Candidatus Acidoferrum sp.]
MSYRSVIPTLMNALLLCSAFWPSGASLASPQKTQQGSQAHTRTNANASKNVDACSLLTSREITAVLGEPLDVTKPTVQSAGNLKMSHCLFVTRNFAKSASLDVATPASGDSGARSLRAFWRNQFHSPLKHQEERRPASRKIPAQSAFTSPLEALSTEAATSGQSDGESESEAEAEAGKPRPIPGLGEEAYWVGSPLAGALYVLQGNLFLRISVGGVSKESTRIAKSKLIANAVLPRLRR